MFQVRLSQEGGGGGTNLPPIHDGPGHDAGPPKKNVKGTANTFNEILENDRLKTEVMVLRTKVKTLTDKLNTNIKEDPRVNQLEHVIKEYQVEVESVQGSNKKLEANLNEITSLCQEQKSELTV